MPVTNAHNKCTRGKAGIRQPMDRLNLNTAVLSTVPMTFHTALSNPHWRAAMQAEFDALQANNTGPWFLSRLVLLLLQGNGSSITSSCLMAHLTATKLSGFFADLLSVQELIMMRLSALSSSQLLFGWFSHWPCLGPGLFISLM